MMGYCSGPLTIFTESIIVNLVSRRSQRHPAVSRISVRHPAVSRVSVRHPAVSRISARHPAVSRISVRHPAVKVGFLCVTQQLVVSVRHPAVSRISVRHPAVSRVSVRHPAVVGFCASPSMSSYGVVDIWEAVLTFIFFPLTVLTAYVADKKLLVYKFLSKKYPPSAKTGVVKSSEGIHDVEMSDGKAIALTEEMVAFGSGSSQQIDYQEFEDHKRDFIEILKELRKKHPNMDSKTLNEMAEYEITTQLRENIGSFTVTVTRDGGDISQVCLVDYYTEDGTATGGEDYVPAVGTLIFHPYEKHKQIELVVIDDDVFEEDEHFYVYLSATRDCKKPASPARHILRRLSWLSRPWRPL
ncbi:Sodium/calcium exchanger 3 [Bulinus truncatus]|nr:Sodium/calcium exchanger 3 [Bulinus truncatus]